MGARVTTSSQLEHAATGDRRFSAPRLPDGLVRRRRIDNDLDSAVADGAIVLVTAPAGAGKTVALAGWAARHPEAVAWLSLEPEDGDPAILWSRILSALQAGDSVASDSTLRTLRAPPAFDRQFVSRVLQAWAQLPTRITLVLDDLHLIDGRPAMPTLASALRINADLLSVVLSSRTEPALPIQRLRLSGGLREIHTADLAFQPTEAALLLHHHDVALDAEQLSKVVEGTEGWAAGLRFAALSLQGRTDVDRAIQEFTGDSRSVADYFRVEVLQRQSPHVRSFLLRTCIVREVSAPLADALTGHDDGQYTLELLEREHLFVNALDEHRRWYRYHHLFSDLLRQRLAAEDPTLSATLHRRAAAWFADNERPLDACRQLAAAGDWSELARYATRSAAHLMLSPEGRSLSQLLLGLPRTLTATDPEVAAAAALGSYGSQDAIGMARHLRTARRLGPNGSPSLDALLACLEVMAAWLVDDADVQLGLAPRALRQLDATSADELPAAPAYRLATTLALARGQLWNGQLAEAAVNLADASDQLDHDRSDYPFLAVCLHGNLAFRHACRGHLCAAEEEITLALALAEESGWHDLPYLATTYLAAALVHLLRDERGACGQAIGRVRACVAGLPNQLVSRALTIIEARLQVSQGSNPALEQLTAGRPEGPTTPLLDEWRTLAWFEATGVSAGTTALTSPVEELIGTALGHERDRHDAAALAAIAKAVELARPDALVRPFVLEATQLTPLLQRLSHSKARPDPFLVRVLAHVEEQSAPVPYPPLANSLTERELSLLVFLPTLMRNADIAEQLYVSVNTVKTHLSAIYRKLGVPGRREAVADARRRGLLND